MKFNILDFRQEKLVELGVKPVGVFILDWFWKFASYRGDGKQMISVYRNDRTYYWVLYERVIDDLPFLQITNTEVIGRHFSNFHKLELLDKWVRKDKRGTYTFFAFLPNFWYLVRENHVQKRSHQMGLPLSEVAPDSKIECPPDSTVGSAPDFIVSTPPDYKVDPKDYTVINNYTVKDNTVKTSGGSEFKLASEKYAFTTEYGFFQKWIALTGEDIPYTDGIHFALQTLGRSVEAGFARMDKAIRYLHYEEWTRKPTCRHMQSLLFILPTSNKEREINAAKANILKYSQRESPLDPTVGWELSKQFSGRHYGECTCGGHFRVFTKKIAKQYEQKIKCDQCNRDCIQPKLHFDS